jgi:GNAT superfamily N-acetyltransferase
VSGNTDARHRNTTGVTVTLASPSEYGAVRALVVEGLGERWGSYDAARNPDLEAFGTYYGQAVVVVARTGERIVGCGVHKPENGGEKTGRIVRMYVVRDMRRTGVGSGVLRFLLESAWSIGYTQVVLETTAAWTSAVAFYRAHGFAPTRVENGDQHFVLARHEA